MAIKLATALQVSLTGDGSSSAAVIALTDLRDFVQIPNSPSVITDIIVAAIQGPTSPTVTPSVSGNGKSFTLSFSQALQAGGDYTINIRLMLQV